MVPSRSTPPATTAPPEGLWPEAWQEWVALLPQGLLLIDREGCLLEANGVARQMLGLPEGRLDRLDLHEARWRSITPDGSPLAPGDYPFEQAFRTGQPVVRQRLGWGRPGGDTLWLEVSALPRAGGQVLLSFEDVTSHHLTEAILAARSRLVARAATTDLRALLTATLDEAEHLTGSCIGFFHFVEADQDTLTLQAWSTRTSQLFCKAEGAGMHYPVHLAGVWADALRTREAVVHNDYAALPHRKGLPEGHAHVAREVVVTVQRNGRVVALLGVGNKPFAYGAQDVDLVQRLADLAWDLVEQKRAAQALADSEHRFRLISEQARDLVYVYRLGPDPGFEFVSPSAMALHGYTPEEHYADPELGRRIVHPDDLPLVEAMVADPERAPSYLRIRWIHKDGRVLWVDQSLSFHRDAEGRIQAVQGVARDVTVEVEAHRALQRAYDELGLAQQAASVGLWDWDLASNQLTWSTELFHIYGLDPAVDRADYETWRRVVHPDDLQEMEARLAEVLSGKQEVPSEYRILRPDGSTRWVRIRGGLVRDGEGAALRLAGVCLDITQEHEAREQLAQSEARSRSILRTALDGIWLLDGKGRFLEVNGGACLMAGRVRSELLTLHVLDIEAEEDATAFQSHLARIRAAGADVFRSHHRRKNGSVFPVEVSATYLADADQYVAFVRDITERQRAEEALRASEQRARASSELLTAIFESPKGVIIYALDRALRYTAYTDSHRDSMRALWGVDIAPGMDILSCISDPEARARARQHFERALAGESFVVEEEHGPVPQQRTWSEHRHAPIRGAQGAILGLTVFVIDTTDRRRSEAALQESESRLRRVVQESPYPVMVHASDGEILQVSDSWLAITGYGPEVFRDIRSWLAVGHRDQAGSVESAIQAFHAEGLQRRETDYTIWTAQGEARDWRVCTVPVGHLSDGRGIVTTMATDVTARNRALAELQASEARAKSMLRTTRDGVWLLDTDGRILDANDAVCRALGYTKAELLRLRVSDIEAMESPAEVGAKVAQVIAEGSALFEGWHRRKDGSIFPVEISTTYLPDLGQFVAYLRDITARLASEVALRASEQRFRTTLDQMAEGCSIFDQDLTYRFINGVGAAHAGMPVDALVGRRVLELFPALEGGGLSQARLGMPSNPNPPDF